MGNFYKDTLDEFNDLFNEGKFDDLLSKIDAELKMPYVPLDFEKDLFNLKAKVFKEMVKNEVSKIDDKAPTEIKNEPQNIMLIRKVLSKSLAKTPSVESIANQVLDIITENVNAHDINVTDITNVAAACEYYSISALGENEDTLAKYDVDYKDIEKYITIITSAQ